MTRSVEELRRDSEQSRAELAATVDRLREQIADTAEDIRYKVSPENIKAEVSGFISHKTHGWLDALKQQAMDNPMQAVAAGTAIAVPALRLARGFPLPLLMIGAGLALSSKTVRDRAAEAAEPALEKVRGAFDETAERAQSLGDGMRKAMSHAERQAAGMADEVQQTAGGMADAASGMASDLSGRATQAADAMANRVRSGMDAASEMAKEKMERVRSTATNAPATASKMIRDNAALIGGLGVAIGAILAASLPSTTAEARVVGQASDRVKRAATTAAQSGFEAAKDTVLSAADAAARSVSEADLGGHASRITEDVTERLKEVADDVVTTAFDPSRNPHN
jgi:gas vesicle protein